MTAIDLRPLTATQADAIAQGAGAEREAKRLVPVPRELAAELGITDAEVADVSLTATERGRAEAIAVIRRRVADEFDRQELYLADVRSLLDGGFAESARDALFDLVRVRAFGDVWARALASVDPEVAE